MPYNKNKQQAFQAAQQAYVQAEDAVLALQPNDEDYGHHLKVAQREILEAEQIIQKAYLNASEHQRHELEKYEQSIEEMKNQISE